MFKSTYIYLWFVLITHGVYAQNCVIEGVVKDSALKAIEGVSIYLQHNPSVGVITNKKGAFRIESKNVDPSPILVFSHLAYQIKTGQATCGTKGYSVVLTSSAKELPSVKINEKAIKNDISMSEIDPLKVKNLPAASGNFESILFSQPGVTSRNEMSSQYTVRGGNFDENLIYVNDVEIYRPFLVRSGQQEGLSFINSDLVSNVFFSAGGFEAKYGDKMSSVLDVTYKEVDSTEGSFTIGLLGANFHYASHSDNHKFKQIHGLRYRTNQYLLGSLETQGDYNPRFVDYQTLLGYEFSDRWSLALLGNIASNAFQFVPQDRQTDFGTIQQALRLNVFFEGQEQNQFDTYTGALTLKFNPNLNTSYRLINALFYSDEREFFDVYGQYRLSELEADLGSEDFGNESFTLGVGGFRNHARNQLNALVYSSALHGSHRFARGGALHWSTKFQVESIEDRFKEWNVIDSSSYSLPHPEDSVGYQNPSAQPYRNFELNESYNNYTELNTMRIQSFLQYERWLYLDSFRIQFTAGARLHYWSYNQQNLISPRVQLKTQKTKKGIQYKFAAGIYNQAPFYRELRDAQGQLFPNIKAQQSLQIVLGANYEFKIWERPFQFTSELYYKHQWNLIPYYVDNVRIRYYPNLKANGRTQGIDLKLNGEFVSGIESWLSVSLLKSVEDIAGDDYYEYLNDNNEIIRPFTNDKVVVDSNLIRPGFIPRPTDQRVNIGLFFQDYLPGNPRYKVHLNLLYGSRIPYGELLFRTRDTLLVPPYRRVDIGFSASLKDPENTHKTMGLFKNFKAVWLTVEVFNLFEINNTISYQWIKDASENSWAIPNYLTGRRINLKLRFEF